MMPPTDRERGQVKREEEVKKGEVINSDKGTGGQMGRITRDNVEDKL